MQSNTHIEPYEKRLQRFQNGTPIESIETLLNSIDNYFNNEIAETIDKYQTTLLFLGIHAVALTIAEVFWNLKGLSGFKKFLEIFVDGESQDTKFSQTAKRIHNWRNILTHQWIASGGYLIQYDYKLQKGFYIVNDILIINPKIYCEYYIKAFDSSGKIWQYETLFTNSELNEIKERIIKKFIYR